jgi:hypothetical protein
VQSARSDNVIFELAVNADAVELRAGDTGEITRRAVDAGKGRVRTKQASHGGSATSDHTVGAAVSNHTESVEGKLAVALGPVCESHRPVLVGHGHEKIVNGTHASLLRMKIRP